MSLNQINVNNERVIRIEDEIIPGNKDLVNSDGISSIGYYEDIPEDYVQITLDSSSRFIEGISKDGKRCFKTKVSFENNDLYSKYDPEGRLEIKTDSDEKILSYRDSKGILYENIGIVIDNFKEQYIQNDPEGRLEIKTDSNGKIFSYRDSKGFLHEEVGIIAKSVKVNDEDDNESGDILKLHPKEKILPLLKTFKWYSPEGGTLATQVNFTLLWFSDLHSVWRRLERITKFYNAYSQYIDDVVSSGDESHTFQTSFTPWAANGASSYLTVIGNHECFGSARTDGDKTIAAWTVPGYSQKECYDLFYKPYLSNTGIIIPENKCYFYKDYSNFNIRIIGISCYHWKENIYYTDGTKVSNYPDGEPVDTGQQQLWLRQTLEDARTNNMHVICMSHGSADYTPETTVSFQGLPPYMATGDDAYINLEMYQEVQTFIDNGGHFITWLNGHAHTDKFGCVKLFPNQLQIVVDTSGSLRQGAGSPWEFTGSYDRTDNTINDDLFNIVSINTNYGFITLQRIGCEYDKLGRHIGCISYDYINKKILFNN